MKCPKCGFANPDDAVDCQQCRVHLEWALQNIKEQCPVCGTEVVGASDRCTNCGSDLEWHRAQARAAAGIVAPADAEKAAQEARAEGAKLANSAMISMIVGILICGVILEPNAIIQARNARKLLKPGDPGWTKAQVTEVLAWIILVLVIIAMFIAFANM